MSSQSSLPSEITVRNPDMDHKIAALTKAFETLTKLLEKSFTEIAESLRTLRRLPEIVEKIQETVVTQVDRLFQQQMEAQVLARYANLQVARKRLESVNTLEQDKMGQLKSDTARVSERYAKLLEQVARDCESNIRRIDSHAFDIVDRIYPKEVQQKFSFESEPALRLIGEHAGESAVARTVQLDHALEDVTAAVRHFTRARETFKADFAQFASPELVAGAYIFNVILAESTDVATGQTETHYLLEDPSGNLKPLGDSVKLWATAYFDSEQALRSRRRSAPEEIAAIHRVLESMGVKHGDVAPDILVGKVESLQ